MRYTPKELNDNVNISKSSPIKELFFLLSFILAAILGIYLLLGLAVDIVVSKLPETVEQKLTKLYEPIYKNLKSESPAGKKIQELLESLNKKSRLQNKYEAYIVKNNQVNALALPGGKIIIFSKLLEEIDSENELAFVLAHELGHFAYRDHLKALGRNLVLFTLSSALLGQDSSASQFLGNSLTKAEMKFSQTQEKNADLFALDLLYKKYTHAGGALEFLEKAQQKEKVSKFFYFFTTHPHPETRVKALKERIKKKKYSIQETTPLDKSFKENLGEGPGCYFPLN